MTQNIQTNLPDEMYDRMVENALAGEEMTDAELARHYLEKGLRATMREDAAVGLDV